MTYDITKNDLGEFQLHGLERGREDSVWLRVDNFDLLIQRTPDGIEVAAFVYSDSEYIEALDVMVLRDEDTDGPAEDEGR